MQAGCIMLMVLRLPSASHSAISCLTPQTLKLLSIDGTNRRKLMRWIARRLGFSCSFPEANEVTKE